jgi:hypothetical protein
MGHSDIDHGPVAGNVIGSVGNCLTLTQMGEIMH